jgi:hypothetical protein
MKKTVILFSLCCMLLSCYSQDINGIWRGKVVMAPSGCFPVYNIELQMQIVGTKVTGTAYHFSDSSNYVRENFEGTYKADSNYINIQENGIITFKIKEDCVPCVKNYKLTYHRGGGNVVTDEQLRGNWTGKATDGKTVCEPGSIVLNRVEKAAIKPLAKLPANLTGRKVELVKEIKVDTGVVKIDFYDNGQIDGDTISVYTDGMPSISQKMLTTKPVSMTIKIDPKHLEHEVIMVGENMGTLPPNTALMIINAGEKRYQLYLTSDEKKNAMVRFVYEKPPVGKN